MMKMQEIMIHKIEEIRTGKPYEDIGNMSRIGSESSFKIPRTPAEVSTKDFNTRDKGGYDSR